MPPTFQSGGGGGGGGGVTAPPPTYVSTPSVPPLGSCVLIASGLMHVPAGGGSLGADPYLPLIGGRGKGRVWYLSQGQSIEFPMV